MKCEGLKTILGRLKQYRYAALILALGLLLMIFPGKEANKKSEAVVPEGQDETGFSLEQFTQDTESLLKNISGAGEVHVLFSLETGSTSVFQQNKTTEEQTDSLKQETETVLTKRDGDEYPLVVEESYPTFRGALILAQGADKASVSLSIKEAVSSLTGLGMDHITVLKMD